MDLIEQYGYVRAMCPPDAGDAFFISVMRDLEGVPAHSTDLRAEAIAQLTRAIDAELKVAA